MPRYAKTVMEHFSRPQNVGRLEAPDAVGASGTPGRPPFMVMHFRLRGGLVEKVRYQTFGCVPAIAAGSALTEMIAGRAVGECLALTDRDVDEALGGLPPERAYCAGLAIAAMRDGLAKVVDGAKGNDRASSPATKDA